MPASPGSVTSELDGVTAISRGDAWAVGSFSVSSDTSQALLLHYTG